MTRHFVKQKKGHSATPAYVSGFFIVNGEDRWFYIINHIFMESLITSLKFLSYQLSIFEDLEGCIQQPQ